MKFYLDESDFKIIKTPIVDPSRYASHLVFLRKQWDEIVPYEVIIKVKKISRKPIKQKMKDAWNSILKKLML